MQISMNDYPKNPPYTVSANIYCEEFNNYLDEHWEAGTFDDYDQAFEKWGEWMPPMEKVVEACRKCNDEMGFKSYYELEVGMWDVNGHDHAFMNQAIEY